MAFIGCTVNADQIQQMNSVRLVCTLLCLHSSLSLLVSHCFSSLVYYPYTVSTSDPYIDLNFTLSPSFSAALALLQSANTTPSLNREDWIHLDPKAAVNYDYDGLVTGRAQSAWLPNPGLGSTLHIYLLNFDNQQTPCYSLRVDELSSVRTQCPTPNFYNSTTYCSSCSTSSCGVYCNIQEYQMSAGSTNTLSLNPYSYSSVRLAMSSVVEISVASMAPGVSIFFQYDLQFAELAGMVNYLPATAGDGSYDFTNGLTYTRYFTNNSYSIAMGIINNNSYPVTLTVSYISQTNTNFMIVLIGVLGALLAVGLLIAIIMIVKRLRQNATIHSELIPRAAVFNPANRNKLTPAEIQIYFPSVLRSMFLQDTKKSWNKDESSQYECVICLCSIEASQEIKFGYCKHFFHAKCLTEWFDKQQNCPYCRKDYSRAATIALYKQIVKERGKEVRGEELVQCLFRPTMNVTMETLQVEDIQDCNL